MKNIWASLIYLGFFGLIGFAVWYVKSAMPLWALLLQYIPESPEKLGYVSADWDYLYGNGEIGITLCMSWNQFKKTFYTLKTFYALKILSSFAKNGHGIRLFPGK